MSFDPLVKDAVDRVWCAPQQDHQAIYRVNRFTSRNGARRHWSMSMVDVDLPDTTNIYHIFSFGQWAPELIALFPAETPFPTEQVWTTLEESANQNNTRVDVYFANGVRVPLSICYFSITDERALVMVIKHDAKIGVFEANAPSSVAMGVDYVYVRIYKNAYFTSEHRTGNQVTMNRSANCKTNTELAAFQDIYNTYKSKPGALLAFRNGYLVKDISLVTCSAGDWVEFVYDDSAYEVTDLPIVGMPTFVSELDSCEKFLVHRPKGAQPDGIDYHDDVDFYLYDDDRTYTVDGAVNTSVAYKQPGIYLHKNTPRAVRMLTHRDYAIPVSMVSAFLSTHKNTALPSRKDFGLANIRLKVVVRRSGYSRALVDDANRIRELYKLPDHRLIDAMVGTTALVPTWVATALEKSAYCGLMGHDMNTPLTKEVVTGAYGYNSVATLLAEPVVKTYFDNAQLVAPTPLAYQKDSTGYEYDANGVLIGWYYHDNGIFYNCRNSNAAYVEYTRGKASTFANEFYNTTPLQIDTDLEWGFYITPKGGNPQTSSWTCVTSDATRYHLDTVSKTVTWLCSATHHVMARSNAWATVYTKTFDLVNGLMVFNFSLDRLSDGVVLNEVTPIPFGEVDVWLNGHYCIPDLDMQIRWPSVCITNKTYINTNGSQQVTVRMKGLCTAEFGFTDANEFGFVLNNRLSADGVYDLRADRAVRIYMGGGVRVKSDLTFVEDSADFTTVGGINGKPYLIKNAVIRLNDYTGLNTYDLMNASQAVDRTVSNYLTMNQFGVEMPTTYNKIPDLHRVYSPFLAAVISAVKQNLLTPSFITGSYTDPQVMEAVKAYLYLIDFDPIQDENTPDSDFVGIEPHCWASTVELNVHQYLFISRVVRIYASGKVKLADHLTVTSA
jgi:hypothetical protein